MRAVILATSTLTGMGPLLRYRPSCLLRIADKPILFYVMEFLSHKKIAACNLFISDFANHVEEQVGDGRRWGIDITIYLIRDPTLPFEVLAPTAIGWKKEMVLLGVGDCLPEFEEEDLNEPALFFLPDGRWTGWGVIPSDLLATFSSAEPFEELPNRLASLPRKVINNDLSTQTLLELKQSNQRVLSHTHSKLSTARMVNPHVWISRAVSLRKTTNIIAPAFIGEHCQLCDNVQIGPNAVIESHCMIDEGSTVMNSVVCQNSYVGEGLSINECIVDRNTLIDLALDTHIHIRDDFILSNLATKKKWRYYPILFFVRFLAALLLIICSPIFLLMWLIYPLRSHSFLKIPASKDPTKWQTFDWYYFDVPPDGSTIGKWFQRLSVLYSVLKGDVHFVGVAPRSVKDVLNLPLDRQNLYLKSKVGFITLSNLDNGPYATADEQYASEIYYAVHMSARYDLKLIFRWIKSKISYLLPKFSKK